MTPARAQELLALRGPYQGGVRPSKSDPPSHPWYAEDLKRGRAEDRGITESEDLEVRRQRVNRTGTPDAVLDRALSRARDLWYEANEMIKRGLCGNCGAPRYADSGRCAAFCGH